MLGDGRIFGTLTQLWFEKSKTICKFAVKLQRLLLATMKTV